MKYEIRGAAYEVVIDKAYSRLFIVGGSVRVYDLVSNEKRGKLDHIRYPIHVYISRQNNIVAVQSTDGRFAFYSANDLSFIGQLKIKGSSNSDESFYYDEEENALYGVYCCGNKSVVYALARISPHDLAYTVTHLPQLSLEREVKQGEKPYTTYSFHRHTAEGYFMIRNFYNIGSGMPRIYESSYARYEKEGSELELKEKICSSIHSIYNLADIDLLEYKSQIEEFYQKTQKQYRKFHYFKNERGLFLAIPDDGIYRLLPDGDYQELFHEDYVSCYNEYNGKSYIGTWKACLIQDINLEI